MTDRTIAPEHREDASAQPFAQPGQCISREDWASLYALRTAWEGVYEISLLAGVWRAVPAVDVTDLVTADTASDLRLTLQNDYAERAERARELESAAWALHQASSLLAEGHQPQMMTTGQVRHLLARYQRRLSDLVRAVGDQ